MASVIAICPYCRAGGVRASETAIGASATCPRCKSSFTVLPEDNLPDWAAKAQPGATTFSAPRPQSAPDETRETGSMPDVTEPSPVLPAEPKEAKPKAAPQPAPPVPQATTSQGSVREPDEPVAPADVGTMLALGALCLVGPAMVATLLPFGRAIGLGLAALGVVAGSLALGSEGRARLAGALAAVLHFTALLVLLFVPSWLGLDPWQGPETRGDEYPEPVAVERGSAAPKPIAPGDWLDGGKASWQFRSARVNVRRAAIGPVELRAPGGAKRITKENYLLLVVQVRNVGLEGDIPVPAWTTGNGPDGVVVTDANDQVLAVPKFEGEGSAAPVRTAERVAAGHSADVSFVFAAPPKSPWVRVRLPGSVFGTTEDIRFRTDITTLPPGK
jgi:hypothetical protein